MNKSLIFSSDFVSLMIPSSSLNSSFSQVISMIVLFILLEGLGLLFEGIFNREMSEVIFKRLCFQLRN